MEVEEDKWLEWIDELSEQEYLIIDDFLDQETIDLISKFFNQKIEEDDFQKAGAIKVGDANRTGLYLDLQTRTVQRGMIE